jgi:Macrocin-O-methyltransferase (TylF)
MEPFMYPKNVSQELKSANLRGSEPTLDTGCSSIHVTRADAHGAGYEIEDWMLSEERTYPAVGAYLAFLRRARQHFKQVAKKMGYWNSQSSHSLGHDKWSVGWAGEALMSMAAAMYTLKSYGVCGGVLECGVYKGSSTACLSWVCRELGVPFYAADSFEGLPVNEGHYNAGDFRGSLEEVKRNVGLCGCLETVQFIPGWYSESLKGFQHPLSLIWMDVDLQQSVVDVMENVIDRLDRDGLIFSDGFSADVDFDGCKIKKTGGEPAGFFRFFEARKLDYKAVPGGAKGLALIVPHCRDDENVIFQAAAFEYLISHLGSD